MANTILAKMAVQIAANTAEFNKALQKSQNELKSFTGGITKLAGTLGVAFGVQQVASFAFEVSKLAGEADGVKAAFDRLPESQKLMTQLKDATAGTVSELELMKRTVQASNFGIALESLPELLKFASIRAQQTGQSVDYLVDSIITGIGRKSPLILDNLGISAVRLKEKFNGASLEAQNIGDVAKAVGAIASEELTKMGNFSDNTSSKVQKLNASWENFKVVLGNAANQSGILNAALERLDSTLKLLANDIEETSSLKFEELAGFISGGAESKIKSLREELKSLRIDAGQELKVNVDGLIKKYNLSEEQAERFRAEIRKVNDALSFNETALKQFNQFAKRNGYDDLKKAADDYIASLNKLIVEQTNQLQSNKQVQIDSNNNIKLFDQTKDAINKNIEEYLRAIEVIKKYQAALGGGQDVNNKNIVNIENLQAKLQELNNEYIKIEESDRKNLALKGQEILKTQELIAELEKYRKKEKEIADFKGKNVSTNTGLLATADAYNKVAEAAKKAAEEIGKFINAFNPTTELPKKITDIGDALRNAVNVARQGIADAGKGLKEEFEGLEAIVEGAIISIADAFGSSLGEGNFKNFGKKLLETVATFAQQLGALLIANGVAIEALKSGNPPAMIAAGIALVAIGSAIKAVLSKQKKVSMSGGGVGSEGGSGTYSSRNTNVSSNAQDTRIAVESFAIRGQDIWVTMKAYESNNKYTRTANG